MSNKGALFAEQLHDFRWGADFHKFAPCPRHLVFPSLAPVQVWTGWQGKRRSFWTKRSWPCDSWCDSSRCWFRKRNSVKLFCFVEATRLYSFAIVLLVQPHEKACPQKPSKSDLDLDRAFCKQFCHWEVLQKKATFGQRVSENYSL